MQAVVLSGVVMMAGAYLLAQTPAATAVKEPAAEVKGDEAIARAGELPPRTSPNDYQFHVQAGKVTIAAEFTGHDVRTMEGGPYTTEDYVMVETALFGPPGTKLQMSFQDFSLRINGKKNLQPAVPYLTVFKSLKDPDWEPPEAKASKTSIGTGGGDGNNGDLPRLTHIPIERERAMQQRVMKVSLGAGDRPLPQAGMLFFEYHGSAKSIHSMELLYDGPAGKASIALK